MNFKRALYLTVKHAFNRSYELPNAASQGNIEEVRRLLARKNVDFDAPGIDVRGNYTNNAVWSAAFNGHTEVLRLLLDRGADIAQHDARRKKQPPAQNGPTP